MSALLFSFPSYFVLTLFLCEIFTGSGPAALSRSYPGHTVLQYTPLRTHIDTHIHTRTHAYTHRHFNCRVITHTMTGKWERTGAQIDGERAKFLPPSLSLSRSLALSISLSRSLSRSITHTFNLSRSLLLHLDRPSQLVSQVLKEKPAVL